MQESSISEKIKELRTDLKMNQKNFSAAIGIRQSTLSSYENGVVTPSNDVLLTIAQKFHVSLAWLFAVSYTHLGRATYRLWHIKDVRCVFIFAFIIKPYGKINLIL